MWETEGDDEVGHYYESCHSEDYQDYGGEEDKSDDESKSDNNNKEVKDDDDDQMSYTVMCNFCDFSSQSYAALLDHTHRCVGIEILAKRGRSYCNYCSLFKVSRTEAYREGDYKEERDCACCGIISSSGDEESTYTSHDESIDDDERRLQSQNNKNSNNNNNSNDDDGTGYFFTNYTKEVLFEFHGNNIEPPNNGKIYQPLEVAELISSLTVKGTSKRGELITLLLQKKLVKGKTALYDTLKKYEEGTSFKLTWNARGAPKKDTKTSRYYTEAINANPKRKPANIVRIVPQKSINKTIREQIRYDIGEDICSAGKHIDRKGWRGESYTWMSHRFVSLKSIDMTSMHLSIIVYV